MPTRTCGNCGVESHFAIIWEDTVQCKTCLGWDSIGGNFLDSAELYSESYFSGDEYLNYNDHASVHKINFQRKWNVINRCVHSRPSTLVDVGCAYGYFLKVVQEVSPSTKSIGFDVNPAVIGAAIEMGLDARVICGELPEKLELAPDLVTLWDAFEHIPKSVETIHRISSWQPKGGVIAISTVNSGALIPQLRKMAWRQFHPPTHLHYPTASSLKLLLTGCGYDVIYQKPFGYYRALEQYIPTIGQRLPRALAKFPIYLNLFDIQLIIAIHR